MAVIGKPSFSLSILIFFRATITVLSPSCSRASHTWPYCPSPICSTDWKTSTLRAPHCRLCPFVVPLPGWDWCAAAGVATTCAEPARPQPNSVRSPSGCDHEPEILLPRSGRACPEASHARVGNSVSKSTRHRERGKMDDKMKLLALCAGWRGAPSAGWWACCICTSCSSTRARRTTDLRVIKSC